MKRLFINFDKAGAEWVVVANLCGDARMLAVIKSGKSPHVVTGSLISGASEELVLEEHLLIKDLNNPIEIEELRQEKMPSLMKGGFFLPRSMSIRQAGKKSNHALNYDEGYRVFALYNEMDESEAARMVNAYKQDAYPNIPVWHESIREELRKDRTLRNCFGRKVRLLGAWDNHLFKKGYAFKPQSTVVDMVSQGMAKAYNDNSTYMMQNFFQMVQGHDSILAQLPIPEKKGQWVDLAVACMTMDRYMSPLCRYSGREFVVKTDIKIGLNYQHMLGVRLTKDERKTAEELRKVYEQLRLS